MKEGQQGLQGVYRTEQHLNWTQIQIGGVSWKVPQAPGPHRPVTD